MKTHIGMLHNPTTQVVNFISVSLKVVCPCLAPKSTVLQHFPNYCKKILQLSSLLRLTVSNEKIYLINAAESIDNIAANE